MKIRGERECTDCGTRWSYYETGSINCPDCGSIRSVGVDERKQHTANPATLDLDEPRGMIETEPLRDVAEATADVTRKYVRTRGFIKGGEMLPLDATFVAAVELQYVARHLARAMRVEDPEELYFLSLLRGAEAGERPPPAEVPDSLSAPGGLAAAAVVDHYRRDLSRYLEDYPDADARSVAGTLTDHKKRIEALDGDVPVETAEAVVQTVVDLSHYVAHDDERALAAARDRLDDLDGNLV
jgi:uncharacterized Zn finger protein (UPF0148 family)